MDATHISIGFCSCFLTLCFEWELITHRLFLPVLGVTFFLSSSLLGFCVLSSGSSPQPSCPYFPLFSLSFQPHLPCQCVCCFPRLLPAEPCNCILSLLWLSVMGLVFSNVQITIFLFLWESHLPPLLTLPNLLFLLLRFSFPGFSLQHLWHNLFSLFSPFFPPPHLLVSFFFEFLYVFWKFSLLPWENAESTDKHNACTDLWDKQVAKPDTASNSNSMWHPIW